MSGKKDLEDEEESELEKEVEESTEEESGEEKEDEDFEIQENFIEEFNQINLPRLSEPIFNELRNFGRENLEQEIAFTPLPKKPEEDYEKGKYEDSKYFEDKYEEKTPDYVSSNKDENKSKRNSFR